MGYPPVDGPVGMRTDTPVSTLDSRLRGNDEEKSL